MKSAILYWSFFVVLFAVTAAQKITTTNGASGPSCGNKKYCISNATCSASGTRCNCPPGLGGNAKLGCVKPDDLVLYCQTDPHVKNFYKEFVSVKTPCRYRLLKYRLPTVPCRVEVYADSYLYRGGNYYVNRVELRLEVYTSTWRKLDVLIEGMAENGVYNFSEWRKKNGGDWATPTPRTEDLGGVKIPSYYDEIDNMASVSVEQCGFNMSFRPADWTKDLQSQVPGMFVVLDESILKDIVIQDTELSSTPEGPSLYSIAQGRQMNIQELALEMTMVNTETEGSPGFEPWCDKGVDDFQKYCYDENNLEKSKQSLDVCKDIYFSKPFLKCLLEKEVEQEFQPDVFTLCAWGICARNSTECEMAKTKIKDINCNVPDSLKKFQCSQLDGETIPL